MLKDEMERIWRSESIKNPLAICILHSTDTESGLMLWEGQLEDDDSPRYPTSPETE